MQALWGKKGLMDKRYDVVEIWRESADDVEGHAIDCGHFIPEEAPDACVEALREFFKNG